MSVVRVRRDKRGTYVAHFARRVAVDGETLAKTFPGSGADGGEVILAGAGLFGAGRASWTIGGNVN
jgi:hypothetical protein